MKNILQQILYRNSKKVPVFFNKYQLRESNYALLGKISTSILHDILTPLTSILIAQNSTNSNLKSFIEHSSKELIQYVDILKNFMHQDYNSSSIHINTEISKSILLLKHKALLSNIQIQFLELNQVYANIHPLHIYQIIINLLSNALDAAENSENKKVIITIRQVKSYYVEISCRDFGKGIPNHIIKNIGEKIISTKSENRGFGLYSVFYIIEEILRGSIKIKSKKDFGTIFICSIPII